MLPMKGMAMSDDNVVKRQIKQWFRQVSTDANHMFQNVRRSFGVLHAWRTRRRVFEQNDE